LCLHRERAIRIENDVVVEIGQGEPGAFEVSGCLSPGFIDLQVNGGGGVLFNNEPTVGGLRAIAKAHRAYGTVGILPTLITDAPEVMAKAASAITAIKDDPSILGVHFEGPHLSLEKRGTHAAEHIRPLDDHTVAIVAKLRDAEVPVMVTLAPEGATPDQIGHLTKLGAIVSIGHTNATAEDCDAAFDAGAACATHLFNAMSPMSARTPGAVGAILARGCPAGLIADGHHVDDRLIRFAMRGPTFLVSDAMPTVGGGDSFFLYGQTVTLEHGRLVNAEGNLAGAHTTLAEGASRLVALGISQDTALCAATSRPAAVIGRPELGKLLGHAVEDVLVLDERLQVFGSLGAVLCKHDC
ncbi:MAG: N-acetylglucosamine-6-phosphate deacetylase, partial [Pseudomonadota bacterium]